MVVYPMDTIRRRMMMQAGNSKLKKKPRGSMHTYNKILRKEGVNGLFKGGLTNFYRGLGGSLILVMYDRIQDHIKAF